MVATADTRPIPVQPPRRSRRRWLLRIAIGLVVLLLLAVAALVVADLVVRAQAEKQIGDQVSAALPKGVRGTVTAKVGGFSALQQLRDGAFEEVTLDTDDLKVQGRPADAHAVLHGVPADGKGDIGDLIGWFRVDAATVRGLGRLAGTGSAPLRLGRGTVSTSIKRQVLFIPITVDLTLTPSLRGQYVHLDPTKAQLRSGALSVPGTQLIRTLLPNGVNVCTAKYLPGNVGLSSLTITPGSVRLGVAAQELSLAELQKGATGSC